MLKKGLCVCLVLFFLCVNMCYATEVDVTQKELEKSVKKIFSGIINEKRYSSTVSANDININVDGQVYNFKYDLSNKPTFSTEIIVYKGMSNEEYNKEISKLIMPAAGYIAVSDVQGVKLYNSMKYFFATYLKSISNGTISTEGLNVMNIDSLVTKSNSKIIDLFDYSDNNINNMYSSKQIITDSKDLKSYVFTIEKKYITENACKLVSKLRVNPEANFSKIVGYTVKYNDILPIDNITKENADFDVELKVGQKYKIISNNKIESYELKGADCIKIDQKNNEIIATNVGIKKGYIYIGEEKKSIYISVEKNDKNKVENGSTVNNSTGENTSNKIECGNTVNNSTGENTSNKVEVGNAVNNSTGENTNNKIEGGNTGNNYVEGNTSSKIENGSAENNSTAENISNKVVNGNIKSNTSTVSINNKEENINIENNTQVENENISDKIVEENENDDILEVPISNVESKSENDLTNKNDEEITKTGIKFDYSMILYIIFILLIVATIIFILIRLKNKT